MRPVPAGRDEETGLPIRVLITGRRLREDLCLNRPRLSKPAWVERRRLIQCTECAALKCSRPEASSRSMKRYQLVTATVILRSAPSAPVPSQPGTLLKRQSDRAAPAGRAESSKAAAGNRAFSMLRCFRSRTIRFRTLALPPRTRLSPALSSSR
jgi:hypothetical protein